MAAVTLQVKAAANAIYSIKTSLSTTVGEAKQALEAQSNTPAANIRLIYSGQVLSNEKTLESYGTTRP